MSEVIDKLAARRAIIPDHEVLHKNSDINSPAVKHIFELIDILKNKRSQYGFPWTDISNSIIYVIKKSAEISSYCTSSGKYNVIVITTGFLELLERACPLLAIMQLVILNDDSVRKENRILIGSQIGKLLKELLQTDKETDDPNSKNELLNMFSDNEKFQRLAGVFLQVAIFFILEHENSHIRNGHLELSKIRDSKGLIIEKPFWSGFGNLLRVCELSADSDALFVTLSTTSKALSVHLDKNSKSNYDRMMNFGISTSVIFTYLFMINDIFPTQYSLLKWSDHPPAAYRLMSISNCIGYWFKETIIKEQVESKSNSKEIQKNWLLHSVEFQSYSNLYVWERDKSGKLLMPAIENLSQNTVDHSFGLHRWPKLRELCIFSLVSRVTDKEKAREYVEKLKVRDHK